MRGWKPAHNCCILPQKPIKLINPKDAVAFFSAVFFCMAVQSTQSATLTYLGNQSVPTGTIVGGAEVGGLSGIFYNPYTDRFTAITDDSRAAGASRLWTVNLTYNRSSFTSAVVEAGTPLKTAGGLALPLADTEGIAGNLDGTFFVSHEGLAAGSDAVSSIPPWIWRFGGATGVRLPGNIPIVQWDFTGSEGQSPAPSPTTDSANPGLDGANHGTIAGGSSLQAGPTGFGTALSIAQARVTTTFTPSLINASQQVTMAAWIKPAVNLTNSYVLGGASGFLRFNGSGILNGGFATTRDYVEVTGGNASSWYNGKWNYVAVTFDNGAVMLYVNGSLVGSNTTWANGGAAINASSSDWTGSFNLGGAPWDLGDYSYSGLIDGVRLLNVVSTEPAATPVLPEAALPVKFLPGDASGNPVVPGASNQSRGVVSNLSLECLGLSPSRRFLFTANEAALRQDYNGTYNSDFNQAQNSETRIVRFTNVPGTPVATEEKVYRADEGTLYIFVRRFNTVPEILPVDDTGRMLVLERGLTQNNTNLGSYRIRIYLVDFNQADATNVAGINALVGASYTRLGKTLLWESSTSMDNVEAMCWGRDIDGFRTLVLASDNNFSGTQTTQFHVLKTDIPAVTQRTLATSASGNGTVTATPALAWYPDGSEVTLTATPGAFTTFTGWSGSVSGTTNPLVVVMDANRSAQASFLSPWQVWQTQPGYFTAGELVTLGAPGYDAEGDGIPNLLEYALNLHPREPSVTGLPTLGADAGSISLTYRKDPTKPDVGWQVEVSMDLVGWDPVGDTLVRTEGAIEIRRATVSTSDRQKKFLRLKVIKLF